MDKKMSPSGEQHIRKVDGLSESPELVQALVRSAGTGIFVIQYGKFVYVNSLLEDMAGYTAKELLGTRSLDYVHPDDRDAVRAVSIESLKGGNTLPHEYRFLRKNGEEIWILERLVSTEYDGTRAAVGSFMNITALKHAEYKLTHQSVVLRALKAIDLMMAVELDLDFFINHVCNLLVQAGNYTNVWVVLFDRNQRFLSFASSIQAEEFSKFKDLLKSGNYPPCFQDLLKKGRKSVIYYELSSHHDQCPLAVLGNTQAVFVARLETAGRIYGIMHVAVSDLSMADEDEWLLLQEVATDISYVLSRIEIEQARKQSEEQLAHMAMHDALTGLPNRNLLNDRIKIALAQAERNRHTLAVMMLDLDHFKDINDTLGHGVGDELLKAVSLRLSGMLRRGDTVARMGGDEFIVLLPQISNADYAGQVAGKIVATFEDAFMVEGHSLKVTISIGIALYPEAGRDAENLLKNADVAMYQAKEAGRDRYSIWSQKQE